MRMTVPLRTLATHTLALVISSSTAIPRGPSRRLGDVIVVTRRPLESRTVIGPPTAPGKLLGIGTVMDPIRTNPALRIPIAAVNPGGVTLAKIALVQS